MTMPSWCGATGSGRWWAKILGLFFAARYLDNLLQIVTFHPIVFFWACSCLIVGSDPQHITLFLCSW